MVEQLTIKNYCKAMIKVVIIALCALLVLTMRIDEQDPFRNKTIVKVMAAHSGKCIVLNTITFEVDYDSRTSFVSCFRQLLQAYLGINYVADRSLKQTGKQALDRHKREVTDFLQKLIKAS